MLVAIPSMGRAGQVRSLSQVPSATVFVPETEVESYRRVTTAKIVGVPSTVRGITATRNWILDWAEDPCVVFIDDDLKRAGWIEMLPFRTRYHTKLTEQQWLGEWKRLFELTQGFGYRVWGTSTESAPRGVYPYKPFLTRTYVTASCMGIINTPALRFDESFPVKEDYELCLRCIREDGGIIGARYLFWENHHWVTDGGCKDYRTQEMEADCIRRLIARYPGMIRRVTRGGSEFSIELEF